MIKMAEKNKKTAYRKNKNNKVNFNPNNETGKLQKCENETGNMDNATIQGTNATQETATTLENATIVKVDKTQDIFKEILSMKEEMQSLKTSLLNLKNAQSKTNKWQDEVQRDTRFTKTQIERLCVTEGDYNPELSIIARLKKILKYAQDIFNGSQKYSKKEDIVDLQKEIKMVLQKTMDLTEEVCDIKESVTEIKDDTGKITSIAKNVEICNGKMKQLDAIHKVLTDKNLELKQKFPACSQDEEAIVQMAEYGRTIVQQLELAARWYARVRPELEGLANEREQHAAELRERVNEAKTKGIAEGRKQIIRELLNKYDDENLAGLFEAEAEGASQRVKILANFLRNEGIAEKFEKNMMLEITEDNINEYRNYIAHVHVGKIRIKVPAYLLNGEIIAKAVIEDVTEKVSTFVSAVSTETGVEVEKQVEAENQQIKIELQNEQEKQAETGSYNEQSSEKKHKFSNKLQIRGV